MVAVGFCGFTGNPLDFHQLHIVFINKCSIFIQHIGKTTGHARAKVDACTTQHNDHAVRHVFAAVIAGTFDNGGGAGIANREPFARASSRKQVSAGGAVQAGVADDRRISHHVADTLGRPDDEIAARHAFADIVVGIADKAEIQAVDVPRTEACLLYTSDAADEVSPV